MEGVDGKMRLNRDKKVWEDEALDGVRNQGSVPALRRDAYEVNRRVDERGSGSVLSVGGKGRVDRGVRRSAEGSGLSEETRVRRRDCRGCVENPHRDDCQRSRCEGT